MIFERTMIIFFLTQHIFYLLRDACRPKSMSIAIDSKYGPLLQALHSSFSSILVSKGFFQGPRGSFKGSFKGGLNKSQRRASYGPLAS